MILGFEFWIDEAHALALDWASDFFNPKSKI
jgi:hypothetical protein